jgi:ribonuclease BN (tRNA processing enzyme)
MADLFIVGSACGFPVPRLGHSSALLVALDKSLLIDAGEPCSRSLIEAGHAVDSIDAILLTHGHSDHTGGLPMLIQSMWISGRQKALTLFLPAELAEPLKNWLDAIYIGPDFLQFELKLVPWNPQRFFDVCGIQVRPLETTHLNSLTRQFGNARFKAYSLRLECANLRILFSGDLGSPTDLENQMDLPLDLLVTEVAHFPPIELFQFLRDKKVRKIVLTHLALELYGNEEALLAEARDALPETQIAVAYDGLRIPI